ncbi:MAG: Flp pilus assembly protein CpaB [Angustibacter sp.]
MNPRQRRGALLLVAASVGALALFFSVLSYVADVDAKVGELVPVVALSRDVPAYQQIVPDDLQLVEAPRRWLPDGVVGDVRDVVGLISPSSLPQGTYAQQGMFTARAGVRTGFREVAILVDAETGVAGKVRPGDRVDVLATLGAADRASADPVSAGSALDQPPTDRALSTRARAQVWVTDALVINVGVAESIDRSTTTSGTLSEGRAVPVTFAVSVRDALRIAYAESFAVKVRLALRGGGDSTAVSPDQRVFTEGGRTP